MIQYLLVSVAFGCLSLTVCTAKNEKNTASAAPPTASATSSTVTNSASSAPASPAVKPAKIKRKRGRMLRSALNNSRFDPQKWLNNDHSFPPPGPPGRISRFDPIIKKMARRYGFDWRLIAAQIYAESAFDTTAKSHCGALGLMQIMPSTARYVGTDPIELELPEVNIATGCLYDRKMVSLWKRNVTHREERLAFALASYNAGRGRVLRSFSTDDSLTEWERVHPLLPGETQDYVHRIALKYDFYSRHALP